MTDKGLPYSPKHAGVVTPGAFLFLRLEYAAGSAAAG